MTLARTYRFDHYQNNFLFGLEAGRIGRAVATGHGYADVFSSEQYPRTGPTAWLPPLYPLLVGAVFKLCGIYSALSAWMLLAINCVASAATSLAIYQIGRRCFSAASPSIALWSTWIWALYPSTMKFALRWVWETSITTALFSAVFLLTLRMRDSRTQRNLSAWWSLFAALWATIALLNPSLLLFLPVSGLWIIAGSPNRGRSLAGSVLAALIFLALLSPWTIRNWQTFHQFIPLRDNFGVELALATNPSPDFATDGNGHPWVDPDSMRAYMRLGEPAYAKARGDAAKKYIRDHPLEFVKLSVTRFYFFWVSRPMPAARSAWAEYGRTFTHCFGSIIGILGLLLALRHRVPAASLFAWAFVLLPLPYYFTSAQPRFRHPLEPLMVLLAVYLFQNAKADRTTIMLSNAFRRLPSRAIRAPLARFFAV
jgi:hypothetical protein